MTGGAAPLARLLEVMRRLRAPEGGCPWDREQTFATIAPYTIEESYEVADAIEQGDPERIRDELGDLLFQVVFHAQLASERGWFDFDAVAAGIVEKLVRRHPHVFAGQSVADGAAQSRSWEALKAAERALRADGSALADVPQALPALTRAAKLGKRAAQLQFDFAGASEARAKVDEELRELGEVLEGAGAPALRMPANVRTRAAEEFGDVLFSIVNWGRHLGLDAEQSLRGANARFERRFRRMETIAANRGLDLGRLDAAGWDALWVLAKGAACES
jgi:MazG family protein